MFTQGVTSALTSDDTARDHALAWLTARLWWERLLTDLHRRADGDLDVVDTASDTASDEPASAPKAA